MSKLVVKSNTNDTKETISYNEQDEYQSPSTNTQTIEHIEPNRDRENRDSIYSSSLSSSGSNNKLNKILIEPAITINNETHSISNSDFNLDNLNANDKVLTNSISSSDSSGINSGFSQHLDHEEDVTFQVKQLLNELIESVTSNKLVSSDESVQSNERFQSFEKLFNILQAKLDDLRAYYIELNDFYELIQNFEKFFSKIFSNENNRILNEDDDANLSMTVDNVLQYFDDILNDVDTNCEENTQKEGDSKPAKKLSFPSSEEDATLESNFGFSQTFITNYQVDLSHLFDFDQLLYIHFDNCIRILNVRYFFRL